jgi:glyceraldehyde 3-phosphate dehydrogenase
VLGQEVTAEEINKVLTEEAASDRYMGIFGVTNEPIVSSDIIGQSYASLADLAMTKAIGNLVKVMTWYDNEWSYTSQMIRKAIDIASA